MKRMIICLLAVACTAFSFSQIPLTVSPNGGNKKASVTDRNGIRPAE